MQSERHSAAADPEESARISVLLSADRVRDNTPLVARNGLVVRCLGPLRIWCDGRDLGFLKNRRARSVLEYLLLHRGRPTPKDLLMHLLWPETAPAAARNNLNVAVHRLRRFLQEDGSVRHVVYRHGGYELDPALPVWLDLDMFLDHAAAARECARSGDLTGELHELTAAEALHGGPLFEDDPYEDWIFGRRRMVLDRYVEVLDGLARRYRHSGDLQRGVDAARRILALQPAHEIAHRTLMEMYAELGQPHLAVRQFEDCTDALRTELDLTPDAETLALYDWIRAGRTGHMQTMNGSLRTNE